MAVVMASCPGKVLMLGGYLIVEEPNVGVSVGTTARFVARVLSWEECPAGLCEVHVVSPQFGSEFVFECSIEDNGSSVSMVQTKGVPSPFLFYSVMYSVAAAVLSGANVYHHVALEVLADNNFYSQRNYLDSQHKRATATNLRTVPRYTPLLGPVSKTGLGSSAAMTTSVVACLLRFFDSCVWENNTPGACERAAATRAAGDVDEKELVHRVSQVAHCVAQGKVGSGFDVYTATFGTCVYRRFPARILESFVRGGDPPRRVDLSDLRGPLMACGRWVERVHFQLPAELQLLLGDVHKGGTETPGMVSKVMAWRRSIGACPESLWERLRDANEKYVEILQRLVTLSVESPDAYMKAVKRLKGAVISSYIPSTDAERLWVEAAAVASACRCYLRETGEAAQVHIEPPELTSLLDGTLSIPGVFAVGCPGAGGYDAVFALVLGEEVCTAVEQYWEHYVDLEVCPLLVREGFEGLVIEQTYKKC